MSTCETSFEELRNILALLSRMLNVTITFFDSQAQELAGLNLKGMSRFCATCRKDPAFDRACRSCDQQHLKEAKARLEPLIYHCHCGLIEGIVPLYSRDGFYMGALMFGQLRDATRRRSGAVPAKAARLWSNLKACTPALAGDTGRLLKYVSEYIIQQELIRVRHKIWAETMKQYIDDHITERITLDDLGGLIGRSASFVMHHFAAEFGKTPKQYLLERKMGKARQLLEDGLQVQQVAERLGFYDAFHFSKQFRIYWGRPPSAFKN
jgi:AraC-like DNA-binding protein/ligand-binding sensor protein